MKNVDYIVVGGGFAGLFFVHQLIKNNKSFVLVSDRISSASEVSGGVVNPIVLHKFTSFWLGDEQVQFLQQTLIEIQQYLGKNYFEAMPVHRILSDENEKQTWIIKSKSEDLSTYISNQFTQMNAINNQFGIGVVQHSGRLSVHTFFKEFYQFLQDSNSYIQESFDFNELNPSKKIYKDISYKHLVFAEGIRVKDNPYFSYLPIIPSKGHHLSVSISNPISEKVILKKKHFFFQMENGQYYVGGTFDRNSTDLQVMETSVQELKKSLEEIYPYSYLVEDVEVGLRPTLTDRRPTLGVHHEYESLFILNGMGTRGVLNGCYFANELYQFIENHQPLLPELDIKRFR
ncbi:MAG: FAD-binding oxidoreductase [Bacteroidetes bacterium]|nr:FAD-binding oxidoreductase [Bacteroidota bacterium]